MKCIIAGGRDFKSTPNDIISLDRIGMLYHIDEVVSGGCTGADKFGEWWAAKRKKDLTVFKADWDHHGKAAGPIRNRRMAEYADMCVLFPGGKGTANMKSLAEEYGLILEIVG